MDVSSERIIFTAGRILGASHLISVDQLNWSSLYFFGSTDRLDAEIVNAANKFVNFSQAQLENSGGRNQPNCVGIMKEHVIKFTVDGSGPRFAPVGRFIKKPICG